MSLESLLTKIQRLHAAVGRATEFDISRFPPTIVQDAQGLVSFHQNFSGDLSQADLLNLAYQVIRSIADLKDHLRAFARSHQLDPNDVEQTISSCLDLALMIDLANADKHSGLPRPSEQRSKRSPKLVDVKRVLQLVLKNPQPGAAFGLRLTPQGAVPAGPSAASVVVTGDIWPDLKFPDTLDRCNDRLGGEEWASAYTAWSSGTRRCAGPMSRV